MAEYRVFLSAATSEFAELRRAVWFQLWFSGWTVVWHHELQYGRETLLCDLDGEITSTNHTVCIVGHLSGRGFPQTDEARDYAGLLPNGEERASYTQWECLLACAKLLGNPGRRVVIYQVTDLTDQDTPPPASPDDDPALQARFRKWLGSTGIARLPFRSTGDLLGQLSRQLPPVPYPAGQILHRDLPASIDSRFIGRESFMESVYQTLQQGNGAAVIAAIAGMSGVGKTRLAVEYARARRQDYPSALLMIGAATPDSLTNNLARLTGELGLPGLDDQPPERQRDAVEKWLRAHPGWLLILDHIDTREGLNAARDLIGRLGNHGHVLVTSRWRTMPDGLRTLELGLLAEADATRFLLDTTEGRRAPAADDHAQASALARELGYLILALTHVTAYLVVHGMSIAEYRARLAQAFERVARFRGPGVEEQVLSTWATLEMTLDRVSAGGRALLERLAFLADAAVPRSLLSVPLQGVEGEEIEAAEAELAAYSLLTRNMDAGTFTTHRLVREVVRRRMSEAMACDRLDQALRWVDAAFEGDPWDVRSWPRLLSLADHAETVADHAEAAAINAPTGRLLGQLGVLFHGCAQYTRGERVTRAALAIDEANPGQDQSNVVTRLNNLASLLYATNRLAEAEKLFRRALAISEASLGPNHPTVAASLNNLALLLQATNRLAEAEPLFRRVVEIFEPDGPNLAGALKNLADLLQATARLAAAEPLHRRALAISEASQGPDHPEVATCLANLAGLLRATNRLVEAEPLYRRALAIFEASLGPDHPEVATGLNNLAGLLRATNRLAEAEPLYRRALAIFEASLGPDHPELATGLNNLAGLLRATNRLAEAEPLSRRMVLIFLKFQRTTGHAHPHRDAGLNNYAGILQALGRTEAEIIAERQALLAEAGLEGL